jgi:hypothetical protein
MSDIAQRVATRSKELLEVFAKGYLKAYKAALVQSLRDAKGGGMQGISKPAFEVLVDEPNVVPETRLESDVYVGSKFANKSRWIMGANYVLTEIGADSSDTGGLFACCGKKSAQVEPEQEAPKDGSTPKPAAVVDNRTWADGKTTSLCMNKECSEEMSKQQRCLQCGGVYCANCLVAVHADGKTKICKPCDADAKAGAPNSKLPLMKDPGDNQRYINFYQYEVELHACDRLQNGIAGAAAASSAVTKAASKVDELIRPKGSEGKFLLVLKHKRPTRPTLTVCFEREDLRDQWRAVIATASRMAPEPITQDPVLRPAFERGYNELRWHVWMWGGWDMDGTEAELLADVLTHAIEREFLGEYLNKIPAEFAKNAARNASKKAITAAIKPAWALLMKGLKAVREKIEPAIGKMLNPLFETEAKLKAKISAPMEEQAKKLMGLVQEKLQEQFGQKMAILPAWAEAQLHMISASAKIVSQAIAEDADKSAATFWSAFDRMVYQGRWAWSYGQRPVSDLVWNEFYYGDMSNVLTRRLYYDFLDDGIEINQAAFRALRRAVQDAEKASGTQAGGASLLQYFQQAYPVVLQKTANDLSILVPWRLLQALDHELRPVVMEKTSEPIKTVCDPLKAMIPEILEDILDPARTCIEIVNDQVVSLEKNIVATAVGKAAEGIKSAGQKIAQIAP